MTLRYKNYAEYQEAMLAGKIMHKFMPDTLSSESPIPCMTCGMGESAKCHYSPDHTVSHGIKGLQISTPCYPSRPHYLKWRHLCIPRTPALGIVNTDTNAHFWESEVRYGCDLQRCPKHQA